MVKKIFRYVEAPLPYDSLYPENQKIENFSFFKPHVWSPKDLQTQLFSTQLWLREQILVFAIQIFMPNRVIPTLRGRKVRKSKVKMWSK